VMAKILLGERPERPNDRVLTDGLWVITQRCLDRNPRQRPEITNVVCYLREVSADAPNITKAGDMTFGSPRTRDLLCHSSEFRVCGLAPTGRGSTHPPMFAYRLWRRYKPNKVSPGSGAKERSLYGLHPTRLEEEGTYDGSQSTHPGSIGLLRGTSFRLLNRRASFGQAHSDIPDHASEKRGATNFREGVSKTTVPAPHMHMRSTRPTIFPMKRWPFLSCTSNKDIAQ